mgnify:CR=1 FL=1
MSDRWDQHFLQLALQHARMSKDPSTKCGALIVGPDREIRSTGFNGFPRGIADTPERLNDQERKLRLMVHGEMNAVLNAARIGVSVRGCSMYLALCDELEIWSGPPCTRCAVEIIQSGITEIIGWPPRASYSKWHVDTAYARELLRESGVVFREVAK